MAVKLITVGSVVVEKGDTLGRIGFSVFLVKLAFCKASVATTRQAVLLGNSVVIPKTNLLFATYQKP